MSKLLGKAQERDAGEGLSLPVPHPWHLIAMKLRAAKSGTRRTDAVDWSDILDLVQTCKIDLSDPEFQNIVLQFGRKESLQRMQREQR